MVVAGDQQTYAIMKNLKKKYPGTYACIHPYPGDWHLLKLSSETFRDMLRDGGLQDLAKAWAHKTDVYQWKDLHTEAVLSCPQEKDIEVWIKDTMSEKNSNEISRFWAQTLYFL